jgi:hypothetical protein
LQQHIQQKSIFIVSSTALYQPQAVRGSKQSDCDEIIHFVYFSQLSQRPTKGNHVKNRFRIKERMPKAELDLEFQLATLALHNVEQICQLRNGIVANCAA